MHEDVHVAVSIVLTPVSGLTSFWVINAFAGLFEPLMKLNI